MLGTFSQRQRPCRPVLQLVKPSPGVRRSNPGRSTPLVEQCLRGKELVAMG